MKYFSSACIKKREAEDCIAAFHGPPGCSLYKVLLSYTDTGLQTVMVMVNPPSFFSRMPVGILSEYHS